MIVSRSLTVHPQSPHYLLEELCWKSLMTLIYFEWYLIPRWQLKSIFARFPDQLLKELVSCESPGECSMLDRVMQDSFWDLFYQLWSTVLQCGALLPIYTSVKLLDIVVSGAHFLTGSVFGCDIAHRRSVAVVFMLYNIRFNPKHSPYGALPVPYMPVRVTCFAVVAHRYTDAPLRCRISQYIRTFILLSSTILMTMYAMVWDWRVSRSGAMPFCWAKLLHPICIQLFSHFSSVCL